MIRMCRTFRQRQMALLSKSELEWSIQVGDRVWSTQSHQAGRITAIGPGPFITIETEYPASTHQVSVTRFAPASTHLNADHVVLPSATPASREASPQEEPQ